MKKASTIIALILVAALAAGLLIVNRALAQAEQGRTELMRTAQSNYASAQGGDSSGENGAPEESGKPSESGNAGSAAGEKAPDTASGGDGANSGETGSGDSGGEKRPSASELLAAGDLSDIAVLAELGLLDEEKLPSLGEGEFTLDALISWMQNESVEAISAQARQTAAQAVASGIGSADNAERRAFAESQGERNYRAEMNRLEEQASDLGVEYLRCRDMAALREENLAFYGALENKIATEAGKSSDTTSAQTVLAEKKKALESEKNTEKAQTLKSEIEALEQQIQSAAGQRASVQADLVRTQEAGKQAALDLETAKQELLNAVQAINTAMGNPVTAGVTITGTLERLPLPDLTAEAAVARAVAERNEIKAAAYAVVRENKALTQLRYQFAPNSPEVVKQQSVLQEAQAAYDKARKDVEADVRSRLSALSISGKTLELVGQALTRSGTAAPEAQYTLSAVGDTWNSNLSGLTAQWNEILANRIRLVSGTAQYNRDMLAFQHADGAGCLAAEI